MGMPTIREVKKRLSNVSPIPCDFAAGDKVTFTNPQGVVFTGHRVIGFDAPQYEGGGFIYLDYDCYWFPTHPENLTKEA